MAKKLYFETVDKQSGSDLLSFVKETFSKCISTGRDTEGESLDKVVQSDDWRCEVLLETPEPTPVQSSPSHVPLGLVVYKLKPTDEFARFGVTNSVEIKTLCLADPAKSSGKGYRSSLLSRVVSFARSVASKNIHVIVSDAKRDVYTFFLDKGFRELGIVPSVSGEASEKLYALTLSGGARESGKRTFNSESRITAPDDSPPRKRLREDSETKASSMGSSFPLKYPREDSGAPGNVLDETRPRKRRQEDCERDGTFIRDSRQPKRARDEDCSTFSTSFQRSGRQKQWRLPLRQPYLQWIKEGKKTIEGRINTGLPARFHPGDEVVFFGGPHSITVKVTKVDSFKSFEDMLKETTVGKCLPDYAHRPVEDAVRLYRSFPGYADKERQYGVLAIHVTCLPSS